jgi:hypothetical protein
MTAASAWPLGPVMQITGLFVEIAKQACFRSHKLRLSQLFSAGFSSMQPPGGFDMKAINLDNERLYLRSRDRVLSALLPLRDH